MLKTLSFEKRLEKLGKVKKVLKGHKGKINSMAILHNDNLISASDDKTLKVWDIKTFQCIFTIEEEYPINSIITLNENTIACSTFSNIKLRDIKEDYKCIMIISPDESKAFNNLLLLHNGNLATYAENLIGNHYILILDTTNNDYKCIKSLYRHSKVHAIINLPINMLAAGSGVYMSINIYNITDYKIIKELKGHDDDVYCLAVIEKANLLISGSNDTTIRLWDMNDD
jgi:WD40 repeat protein